MNFFQKLFGNNKNSQRQQNPPLDIEAQYEKAMEVMEKFSRKAYLPIVASGPNTFSAKSKMGGYPYLRNENDWPVCPKCKKHMQLFVQFNINDPVAQTGKELYQLFYCTSIDEECEFELEAFSPFSQGTVCRKIEVQNDSTVITPHIDEVYEEKVITGWEAIDDYPHPVEYHRLGIDLGQFGDAEALMEERKTGVPIERDKLFGWPYWVQDVEYPNDRKTGKPMQLLFQVNSEENLPHMFGDAGIGHLTQSTDDKDEMAFGWACY